MLKTPAKKAGGGGITLSFDSMTGVTLHTGTPGWKVYTISSTSAMTRTITATVASDTSINIVVCGGGGGSKSSGTGCVGGSGGGRFREIQKFISALTPTQTFTCTIPAIASNTSGGASILAFNVPSIGDISCGGGGAGTYEGGGSSNAPANGGSGGGGGSSYNWGTYKSNNNSGGTGVTNGGYGFNTGTAYYYPGANFGGGGGGAGGNGVSANESAHGAGGVGISATLAGITAVYNNAYKFCTGGHGNHSYSPDSTFGSGSTGAQSSGGSKTGNAGAVIIAVPA